MTILANDLFEQVLINPVINDDFDTLNVVSGYASPSMVFQQLNSLKEKQKNITLNLIVGMTPTDGIIKSSHLGFKKLMEDDFLSKFNCSYVQNIPTVHSKIYIWSKKSQPISAYAGSANYTLTGFGKTYRKQKEVLTPCDPTMALDYFKHIEQNTIYCNHIDAEVFVTEKAIIEKQGIIDNVKTAQEEVKLSFISKKYNDIPTRSSLNWGQRPELGRNPNQAYIPIPSTIYGTDFFPPVGVYFTVHTDDQHVLLCTRAQENGKAIHTPQNNSLLGEYFRNRLSLSSGALVTKADLEKYGRTEVTFIKIDDENYFMNFSV